METAKTFICVSNYFKGTGLYFRDKLVMRMRAKSFETAFRSFGNGNYKIKCRKN